MTFPLPLVFGKGAWYFQAIQEVIEISAFGTIYQGVYAGNEFWACSAYPKCRYVEAVTGDSHPIH